ncbi:MATE family efflux transporter [Leptotrichia sp. oral taxon 221]|uniref:MATE family efflux transporter n=1 Tax=Leptotrichia sp. oral taxon 221 TaxID=712362 RepID=UPI001B8C33F7|nr:MATE family efflux transporter [Leptotrichia sp. oral taxon 221]QUB97093.1 MATE family efflux transporter [Leptotrichia sp. oral taxon 221]
MTLTKRKRPENKMGTMPINKLIINMSLPLITSMFVQAFYNIVDSLFVARINEDALTAVSMSFPAQNLMISAGVGVGVGITALIARYLGAHDEKGITRVVHNGIFLGILNSILFALFGIFLAKFYFEFQKASGIIETYGIQYLSICSIFAFSIIMEITFERMLIASGKTIYTMITQSTGAIINIIFDPIFIFGLFGFPKMGIVGAAVATIFGQTVAMFMALYFNVVKNHEVRISIKKFAVDFKTIVNIYEIGFPSIVMQSAASFMIFQLNNLLASFSTTATAVLGVYFKLQSFVILPVFGLNNSVISIVSYNYGAGKIKRLLKTVKVANIYAFSIMLAGFVLCQILPVQILKIFDASDNMLAIGVPALRIISFSFLIAPFSIVSSGTFQSLGKGTFSLIISLIRQLIVILPLSYLLSRVMGMKGVWIAFPIAEIVAGILTTIYLRKLYKNEIMKRNIKRHR